MLKDTDLKFASHQLNDGGGASAGLSTIEGGAAATRKKHSIQEVVALGIQNLTKKLLKMLKDFMLTCKMQLPGFFLLHQLSVIPVLLHDQTVLPLLAAIIGNFCVLINKWNTASM
jgi:hypothetical protein